MSKRIFENISWMSRAVAVPEISVDALDRSRFDRDYIGQNNPVIIRGAVRDWPAVQRWDRREYLNNLIGHYQVNVYPHVNYTSPSRQRDGERQMAFAEALDLMHSPEPGEWTVPSVAISADAYAELLGDIGELRFLNNPKSGLIYPDQRYFMYKGGGTGWHLHPCDETLLCQIVGEKTIGLLKGDAGQNKVVKEIFSKESYWDDGACFTSTHSAHLRPLIATIRPGDALYLPPFWWHGVVPTSPGFGISMAKCWRSPGHIGGDLAIPAVRDLWLHALRRPGRLTGRLAGMTAVSMLKKLV